MFADKLLIEGFGARLFEFTGRQMEGRQGRANFGRFRSGRQSQWFEVSRIASRQIESQAPGIVAVCKRKRRHPSGGIDRARIVQKIRQRLRSRFLSQAFESRPRRPVGAAILVRFVTNRTADRFEQRLAFVGPVLLLVVVELSRIGGLAARRQYEGDGWPRSRRSPTPRWGTVPRRCNRSRIPPASG